MNKSIMKGLLLTALVLLTGCGLLGPAKPTVIISSPASGSQYQVGQDVAVQSTSSDAQGIIRVELFADGNSVKMDPSPTGQAQAQFTVIQVWKANSPGAHTLIVRATDNQGNVGESAVTVNVTGEAATTNATATPAATSPSATTAPSVATATNIPPAQPSATGAPSACTNAFQFIADVTIPDGQTVAPGGSFVKTWRVKNTGTCTWDSAYTIVFVAGEQLGAPSPSLIPQAAPGATIDISLSMVAPASPGVHSSGWRLRAGNGVQFGATLTAVISVPGTPVATGCSGTPNISSFTASPSTINLGQSSTLSWGAVTNADAVDIDQGIGGKPTPGSVSVSPTASTLYTLTAHCGATTATRQVKVTVVVYDLIAKANIAVWQSSPPLTNLSFNGSDVDPNGFVIWRDNFLLNDGSRPARVLETHPKWVANGVIVGTYTDIFYSGYTVQASDHISGKIGFLSGASAGTVTFKVMIRPQGGPNTFILSVPLAYADGVKPFDVSLAGYVGKRSDFFLEVDSGASAGQDWAVWQDVRITR